MTERPANLAPDRLLPLRPWRWTFIAAACLLVAVVQVRLNERWRADHKAHAAAVRNFIAADQAARQHAQAVHDQLKRNDRPWQKHPLLADAERSLNNGRPFGRIDQRPNAPLLYVDPTTSGRAQLEFNGEEWTGASPTGGAFWNDPRVGPLPNPNRGLRGFVMIGRRLTYMSGYVVWAILLFIFAATAPAAWRYARVGMALTLVEFAAVSTFLAFLGPRYLRAWDRLFPDDAPAWGLIATAVSLAVLALTIRQTGNAAPAGPPRCGACAYDLTGNESGVCPECGTAVALRPA